MSVTILKAYGDDFFN